MLQLNRMKAPAAACALTGILVVMLPGCASPMSKHLVADARLAEEIGRSREVADLVLELRAKAHQAGEAERWYGFAERAAKLSMTATSLSMNRARAMTASERERAEFYASVDDTIAEMAAARVRLRNDALANAVASSDS